MLVTGRINRAFFDAFSLVHLGLGIGLALFGLGLGPTLAVAAGWEVAERALKAWVPGAFLYPSQDTWANSAGDLAAAALGWLVTQAWRLTTRPSAMDV